MFLLRFLISSSKKRIVCVSSMGSHKMPSCTCFVPIPTHQQTLQRHLILGTKWINIQYQRIVVTETEADNFNLKRLCLPHITSDASLSGMQPVIWVPKSSAMKHHVSTRFPRALTHGVILSTMSTYLLQRTPESPISFTGISRKPTNSCCPG
ncbi:hypothetical protein EI94DRAFT_1740362 [Lactarius quietus]|nr:hypothetical protein EI94DRAFT_1740362 [Lactarius quietus]